MHNAKAARGLPDQTWVEQESEQRELPARISLAFREAHCGSDRHIILSMICSAAANFRMAPITIFWENSEK